MLWDYAVYIVKSMDRNNVVLMVDNEPLTLRLFGSYFARAGLELIPAYDCDQCHEIAKRMCPRVILLGYSVSPSDGLKTLARLKSEDVTRDIPVIVFTNKDFGVEAAQTANKLGVNAYFHKGVPFKEVLHKVHEVLVPRRGHTSSGAA
ncbi:MAG: hypothetical protein A3B23_03960 [Candidatus Colwellbacteria bacterium RIFCSPLOWO2_01_FULL_48_10]|uniref:Response regulatory domain-containing protein n=2 Tax=Bacteria candidate phyla TaxID=1783234 RepID=A0A1F5P095_9BACT|nr:MAG: hypothetical protein A2846_01795 [Candidatus Doudnabacteria bacterium RIFCSPHIGHO2_01_FULL_49_9]OGY60106.1 MAG: hypothetical protein A3B23_03960 [Candidatus Colwellbacteria bacterium RIFCSPLOWO2_01_FULL_48_10]